jgi:hypothetical protein
MHSSTQATPQTPYYDSETCSWSNPLILTEIWYTNKTKYAKEITMRNRTGGGSIHKGCFRSYLVFG